MDPRAEAERELESEPLEIAFTVACPPEHAFTVWAQRTSLWWPHGHSVSGDPGLTVTIEPRAGGRIYERTRRARSTTGARSSSGSRPAGWPTCGTCASTAPTRLRSRSRSRRPTIPPPRRCGSSTAAGSAWARRGPSGASATAAAGLGSSRTTCRRARADRPEDAVGVGVGEHPVGVELAADRVEALPPRVAPRERLGGLEVAL